MSVLPLIRDGAFAAAELVALLFQPLAAAAAADTPPSAAAPPAAVAAVATPVSTPVDSARALHLIDASLDVRLLGLLADVRVVQTLRNDSVHPIDLAAHLPAAGSAAERLSIARDGRTVALPMSDEVGCGGDEDDPHAGHASTALDETLADLLQLPAGQQATIDVSRTDSMQRHGGAYRVALPATVAPLEAQALLVRQSAGSYLVVVSPAGANGPAILTLRPAHGRARSIALGHTAPGDAIVVPLSESDAVAELASGAIELEVRTARQVVWTTLPARVRDDVAERVARTID